MMSYTKAFLREMEIIIDKKLQHFKLTTVCEMDIGMNFGISSEFELPSESLRFPQQAKIYNCECYKQQSDYKPAAGYLVNCCMAI
jgi:hypothetical protein